MEQWRARVRWTEPAPLADQTLQRVAVNVNVIEEFRPLAESLEWRLADLYWQQAGVLPFAENEVPFRINNSGRLSEAAARLLLDDCLRNASTDEPIVVLEFGAGTGLFARFFLDVFRDLCVVANRDFYRRLRFVVTDRSPATLAQWAERNLFADHADRIRCLVADAAAPELPVAGPVRAVFCNYVLDVLPAAVIRRAAQGDVEQLCVRTHLADGPISSRRPPPPSSHEVQALVSAGDVTSLSALLPLLDRMEYEVAFRNEGTDVLPGAAEALAAVPAGERLLLNHAALACLKRSAASLAPGGFILINDYGPTELTDLSTHSALQRFGRTTAFGLNFPPLERELGRAGLVVSRATGDETRPLHTRLITQTDMPETRAQFENLFCAAAHQYFEAPIEEARQHVAAGRTNEALAAYRLALTRNRLDWALIGEIAELVNNQARDHQAAVDLARAAVELNPHYSPWLWNVLATRFIA